MPKSKTQFTNSPTMQDLLAEVKLPTTHSLRRGDVVEGTVLTVSSAEALIDIGAKSEGILSYSEYKDRELKPADKILVYVLTPEDKKGQIRLSLKRAKTAKSWLDLQEAVDSGQILPAEVTGHNKGGLTVDVLGQKGFIPFSHLENPPDLSLPRPELQSSLDKMRGETLQALCLEADPANDRIILSERLALHAQEVQEKKMALAKLTPGETFSGKVTTILPYGLNVELIGLPKEGTVEGLVETEEITWEPAKAPLTADSMLAGFEIGQEVKVKVLSVDEKSGKIRLSIRETQIDPWVEKIKKLKPGSKPKGEVIKISSLGISLLLKDGIEGLLPLNKLPEDKKEVKIGEQMTVIVDGVDEMERTVRLRMG